MAPALLGKVLVHGSLAARIVETEAYLGLKDRAAHAWRGITARTKVIFGPPGHAYVYLIYGMYECLNFTSAGDGSPACVLIRALEPLEGIEDMRTRRGPVKRERDLTNGPGKLTIAMGITRAHNGVDLTEGELIVCRDRNRPTFEIATSPRIGITHNADWPLRFYVADNPYVSKG